MPQVQDDAKTEASAAPPMGVAAKAADLEENLLGDMRDRLLRETKRHFDWSKLPEAKQASFNSAMEQVAREIIRDVAWITAGRSYPVIPVSVNGMKAIKDGMLEAKVVTRGTEDTVLGLFHASRCVLVLCDHDVFMGERAPAPVDKQQPGLFTDETPEQRATRETIDFEAREHEASIARAKLFKPLDDSPTKLGDEVAKALGDKLDPKVKAAADRGRALRLDGGAYKIPADLEGKPPEVNAFLKAWEAADREGGAPDVEPPAAEAADPARKPKRGGRPKGTSAEERVARNLASVEGANAAGTYEPA